MPSSPISLLPQLAGEEPQLSCKVDVETLMDLIANSNEKLLLTFQGGSLCMYTHPCHPCLCHRWIYTVALSIPEIKAISFRATIPSRSQLPAT